MSSMLFARTSVSMENMNRFMFSMLTLVLANNMLLMFVGWEGVGLCSYLLIGFYFLKKSASDAGKKAFIVNRIGDAGFILGILLTAVTFATIRFTSAGLTDTPAHSGILQALDGALSAHALAAGAPGDRESTPLKSRPRHIPHVGFFL